MKAVIRKHLIRTSNKMWSKMEDPRQENKCKWGFIELMGNLLRGMLSGCKNLREVEDLSEIIGERIPDTTLHDVIVRVNPEPLNKEIAKQVKKALRSHEFPRKEFPVRVVAVDGKSIYVSDRLVNEFSRRTERSGKEMYMHMALRAMLVSSTTPVLLGQRLVEANTNECGVFRTFIDSLITLYGKTDLLNVISIDAGIVSAANASYLIEKGLNYVIALKDERSKPVTKFAVRLFKKIYEPSKIEEERQNGKTIRRELFRVPWKNQVSNWDHIRELWKIRKTVIDSTGKKIVEDRFFATSIPSSRLSGSQVLQVIRMHWKIENNSNWVLDTAWQEDNSPWCSMALELVSLLRICAYNIVSRLKHRRLRNSRAIEWKTLLEHIRLTICDSNNGGEILATD